MQQISQKHNRCISTCPENLPTTTVHLQVEHQFHQDNLSELENMTQTEHVFSIKHYEFSALQWQTETRSS